MGAKFFGRKFMVTVVGIGIIVANHVVPLGISPDDIHHIVMMCLGYIIGEGSADVAGAITKKGA